MWVTGAEVLTHVGNTSPTAADTAWSAACAAAIDAEVIHHLGDSTIADDDTSGLALAIKVAARTDAAALYQTRKAPHGVLELGPEGEAVRLGANDLRALTPVLYRVSPGIG